MPALLSGRLPVERYGELLRNLRAVYAALEPALATPEACAAGVDITVRRPELARLGALDADLARLAPRMVPGTPLAPAAVAFARHLESLPIHAPLLLAAHAYVRYLGDLSGGQILRRIVARAYGDGDATAFYAFGSAEAVAASAAALRDWLDSLPVDAAGRDAIAAEAVDAFARHERLFDEV